MEILVIKNGEFGNFVTSLLEENKITNDMNFYVESFENFEQRSSLEGFHYTILLTESENHLQGQKLNELSFKSNVPWFQVTLDLATLIIGPVLKVEKGSCYKCYISRKRQSSQFSNYIMGIQDHLAKIEPNSKGYLNEIGVIAEQFIYSILKNFKVYENGLILEYEFLYGQINKYAIQGVHACPYCGTIDDENARSYENILYLINK